jgi:hypothetical protein
MIVYEGKIRPYYPPYGQTWTPARQGYLAPHHPTQGQPLSLHLYSGVANPPPHTGATPSYTFQQGQPIPPLSHKHRGNPFPLPLHRGSQSPPPTTLHRVRQFLPSLHRGNPFPPPPHRSTNSSPPPHWAMGQSLLSSSTQGQPLPPPRKGATNFLHPHAGATPSQQPYTWTTNSFLLYSGPFLHLTYRGHFCLHLDTGATNSLHP